MVKERPHYYGHRQRLREKFLDDSSRLADYELLEALLGVVIPRRDTKPIAKELLQRFGNLKGVFAARRGRTFSGFRNRRECGIFLAIAA